MAEKHEYRKICLNSMDDNELKYILTRKNIKNLILKLDADANLLVSSPMRMGTCEIEEFIYSKSEWISKSIAMQKSKVVIPVGELLPDVLPCFEKSLDRTMDLCYKYSITRPDIKVKRMKSFWGRCEVYKRIITLNSALYHLDTALLDYVTLHEVVHFLHIRHDRAFWDCIENLMPDARLRRKKLNEYIL